jgi:hypothetical protein
MQGEQSAEIEGQADGDNPAHEQAAGATAKRT